MKFRLDTFEKLITYACELEIAYDVCEVPHSVVVSYNSLLTKHILNYSVTLHEVVTNYITDELGETMATRAVKFTL